MDDRTSQHDPRNTWRTGQLPPSTLDNIDRAILGELQQDGRMSVRTLAERVHVSRANAYARINRLLSDGVITGFSADIDAERAGLGTSAYVLLSIQQNTWRDVADALSQLPFVEHYALVGGDFDVLTLVRTPNNAELRRIVLERIHEIPGVRSTRTWLIFDEHHGQGPTWNADSTR
ncbi:Lrp/AsnC family transcriptional regulator [Phytoactinopolyspora endophytica]|uniref:Lrp/AsnC family transcriptional regulator n=1 Tax=Phytoactinopolyspora endophytica TaxID=1642495 RepID=UPI00101DEF03|nr:Lrp/AsnC family transcriptional regulator [Phytoactinopolyspora endophytica]